VIDGNMVLYRHIVFRHFIVTLLRYIHVPSTSDSFPDINPPDKTLPTKTYTQKNIKILQGAIILLSYLLVIKV